MGRQIGVYTILKDEMCLAERLQDELDSLLLESCMSAPNAPTEIGRLKRIRPGKPNEQDPIILVPGELSSNLKIDQYGPEYFRINEHHSPIIVWSRSLSSLAGSFNGRLWYEKSRPGNRLKSKVFLAWAERVFRLVKRQFERNPTLSRHYLVGPDFRRELVAGKIRIEIHQ
jgi:hypothetical protein